MQKRVVSLLLATVMLFIAIAGAWADEKDVYRAFVDPVHCYDKGETIFISVQP